MAADDQILMLKEFLNTIRYITRCHDEEMKAIAEIKEMIEEIKESNTANNIDILS